MDSKFTAEQAMRTIGALVCLLAGCQTKIVWGQKASCSSSGVITLPRPKVGSPDEIALLTRKAMHEVGHKKETDLQGMTVLNELEFAVFNALEDPRIESRLCDEFPGGSIILNRGLDVALPLLANQFAAGKIADQALSANIFTKGYLSVAPHKAFVTHGNALVAQTNSLLDPHVVVLVDEAVQQLKFCSDSKQAIALAKRLAAAIEAAPKENEGDADGSEGTDSPLDSPGSQDPDSKAGEQSRQGDDGKLKGSEPAIGLCDSAVPGAPGDQAGTDGARSEAGQRTALVQPPLQDSSSATGDASKGEISSDVGPGDDMGSLLDFAYQELFGQEDVDVGEAPPSAPVEVTTADLQKVSSVLQQTQDDCDLDQLLSDIQLAMACGHPRDDEPKEPSSTQCSKPVVPSSSPGHGVADEQRAPSSLVGVIGQLVRVFLRAMQDARYRPSKFNDRGGAVAPNRVWRLKHLGDTNVFRAPRRVSGIDAAVKLLLDGSQSMGSDIVTAASSAAACAQAFERISNVSVSIALFPGLRSMGRGVEAASTLLHFGEPAKLAASLAQTVRAQGTTPLTQALREVVPDLLDQKVEKRFLIVISDGDPDDKVTACFEIARALELGIEVLGIEIGRKCDMASVIPTYVHVDDVAGLPAAFEELFRSKIACRLVA